jgi:hypothetical protein
MHNTKDIFIPYPVRIITTALVGLEKCDLNQILMM